MSITGEPDDEGGRPVKVGVAISDVVDRAVRGGGRSSPGSSGGPRAAAATGRPRPAHRREPSREHARVLVNQAQNAFVTGQAPGRLGSAHPNIVPYETFVTADGELALAVASERQWPRLCEALGLPALAADPRFATNGDRVVNRAALRPLLAAAFLAPADRRRGSPRSTPPTSRAAPINDVAPRSRRPRRRPAR